MKVAILASKSIYIKFWHRMCRCAKSLDSLMFVERDLISRSAFRAFNFYEKTKGGSITWKGDQEPNFQWSFPKQRVVPSFSTFVSSVDRKICQLSRSSDLAWHSSSKVELIQYFDWRTQETGCMHRLEVFWAWNLIYPVMIRITI